MTGCIEHVIRNLLALLWLDLLFVTVLQTDHIYTTPKTFFSIFGNLKKPTLQIIFIGSTSKLTARWA